MLTCEATPIATIDSKGDEDDQPVTLGEVTGDELPAVGSEEDGPAMSRESATAHSARRAPSPTSAAATSSLVPTSVLAASLVTDRRRAGSSRLAIANSAMWAPRTTP